MGEIIEAGGGYEFSSQINMTGNFHPQFKWNQRGLFNREEAV